MRGGRTKLTGKNCIFVINKSLQYEAELSLDGYIINQYIGKYNSFITLTCVVDPDVCLDYCQ